MPEAQAEPSIIPTHIAIIPDGNRRWAVSKGLAPMEGHKVAYERGFEVAEMVAERGVKFMTFYAFSTENWQRAQDEVGVLLGLLERFVLGEMKRLDRLGFKIRFFGSRDGLSENLRKGMDKVEHETQNNSRVTLNICMNYGGRQDILDATAAIVRENISPELINEAVFEDHLSSHGTPPPDLIVRTSGEKRLSNYLLWEAAYAELIFFDLYWPEFGETEIDLALSEYARRRRRFGA